MTAVDPPHSPPAAPARTDWRRQALLFACGVAVAFQIGKVPGALPALKSDLGLSLLLAGWVVSIFNAITAGVGAGLGVAADHFGHRRMALSGLVLSASAGIAGAFVVGPGPLLATRAVEGFGLLLTAVAIPPLMVALAAPADRAKAMGLWGAYMPTGMAAMLLASGPLLSLMSWRGLWLVTSALILAVAAVVALAVPRTAGHERPPRGRRADVLTAAARPGPLLLAAVFTTYAAQFLAVMAFLPLLLVEQAGLSPARAAALGALAVAVNALGNVAAGFLLAHTSRARLLVATCAVMAVGGALVFLDGLPLAVRYGGALAFSAVGGIIPGALFAGVPVHAPRPALLASVSGLMIQGAAFGQLVGPPIVGAIVAALDTWQAASLFVVAAAGVTALSALALGRVEARRAAQASAADSAATASHSSSK